MGGCRDRSRQREPRSMLELELDFNFTIPLGGGMGAVGTILRFDVVKDAQMVLYLPRPLQALPAM